MFIMVDGRQKMYIGGIDQASVAGAIYDRAAIQLKGRKVRREWLSGEDQLFLHEGRGDRDHEK